MRSARRAARIRHRFYGGEVGITRVRPWLEPCRSVCRCLKSLPVTFVEPTRGLRPRRFSSRATRISLRNVSANKHERISGLENALSQAFLGKWYRVQLEAQLERPPVERTGVAPNTLRPCPKSASTPSPRSGTSTVTGATACSASVIRRSTSSSSPRASAGMCHCWASSLVSVAHAAARATCR